MDGQMDGGISRLDEWEAGGRVLSHYGRIPHSTPGCCS